jgi:hypothetical protein
VVAVVQGSERCPDDFVPGTLDLVYAGDGFDPTGAGDVGDGVDRDGVTDRGPSFFTRRSSDWREGWLSFRGQGIAAGRMVQVVNGAS